MKSEKIKSIIRHVITGLGAILAFIGLGQFSGLLDVILENLDTVTNAVITIIGFATAVIGFFKDKTRLEVRANNNV